MKYWILRDNDRATAGRITFPAKSMAYRLKTGDRVLWLPQDGGNIAHWSQVTTCDRDEHENVVRLDPTRLKRGLPVKIVHDAIGREAISDEGCELNPEQLNAIIQAIRETNRSHPILDLLAQALKFEDVLAEELQAIELLRNRPGGNAELKEGDNAVDDAYAAHLTGIAFSGGGIRSATFNLGVLQALAKMKLLSRFDYLSTVSGGGYIGSWLVSWIARSNMKEVAARLPGEHKEDKTRPAGRDHPVTHLRRFSNYLTPKLGMFSADLWTMVATYGRNLLLNLLILVLALSAVLFVPRLVVSFTELFGKRTFGLLMLAAIGLLTGVIAVFFSYRRIEGDRFPDLLVSRKAVQILVACPLFISAWLGSGWLWYENLAGRTDWPWWRWMLAGGAIYFTLWLAAMAADWGWRSWMKIRGERDALRSALTIIVYAIPAGLVGGFLLQLLAACLAARGTLPTAMACGPPLFVMVIILTAVLHIGLLGRGFRERHRQWWSRLGAWLMIYAIVWILGFAAALFSPAALRWLASPAVLGGLSLGWLASTIAGLLAARSSATGGPSSKRSIEILASVTPYIFIAGMIMLLALGVQKVMELLPKAELSAEWALSALQGFSASAAPGFRDFLVIAINSTWLKGAFPFLMIALMTVGLAFIAWLLSTRVDINEFSMHLFYRSRLVRAYLGATNPGRWPQPFTGFDPRDDIDIAQILTTEERRREESGLKEYSGPFPIINTTLNLAAGRDLAWQERKAASFVFTPLHYGFDQKLPKKEPAFRAIGASAEAGGISLGTALTISGAAVNPNMGYHSVPSLAFLMTVFNARLGWWLRNPGNVSKYWRDRPRSGLLCLLAELFGQTRSTSRYVNLADGGFFDNLGIYELVRRRCRLIVACDAESDKDLTFGGLGNAIRKIRNDFGIDIVLDVEPIKKRGGNGFSDWHCAVGTIHYDRVDPGKPDGTLIYLKSSLTGDEPEDLLAYAAAHDSFPHESTADQWFDESQFESYRRLGFHVARETFGIAEIADKKGNVDIERVAVDLRQSWHPPSIAVQKSFTTHARLLDEIFERIRTDKHLRFLDSEIYMELAGWGNGWPQPGGAEDKKDPTAWNPYYVPKEKEFRAGFYLCNSVIQLMENVYIDLDLEHEWKHPDNRGWMNLFKHWSWSRMFKQTWSVSACTYGARFQRFCERRLGLELGVVWGDAKARKEQEILVQGADPTEVAVGRLNYLECSLIQRLLEKKALPGRPWYVMPLEVHVLHPREAHCRRLREDRTEPARGDRKKTLLSFTIGFAVLVDSPEQGAPPELGFLRIRDHLRTLGLGRASLRHLRNKHDVHGLVHLEPDEIESLQEIWPEANWGQFIDIFQSVERERPRK